MSRPFKTAFPPEFLPGYQAGVMGYSHRGVPCLKSPIDMAIQARALWELRPATIFEIGSRAGGSALWFADMAQVFGLNARIVSIDLEPPALVDPRITFLAGDVHDLRPVLARNRLLDAPHPWFVSEDSAHSRSGCAAALALFGRLMVRGDLMVMEDGVLEDLGWADRYDGGPNRAIAEHLATHPGSFAIDTGLCDSFGQNATYAPNGYLRKL